jgi:hypothetical protein
VRDYETFVDGFVQVLVDVAREAVNQVGVDEQFASASNVDYCHV